MARSGRSVGPFGWFRHRWLVGVESILLVGVAQELLQRHVKTLGWPWWGQTLWIMGCTLGMLGGLVLVLRLVAVRTVARTHQVVARRLPLPLFLVHVAALAGLFCLYAWVWHLWPRAF